MVPEVIRPNSHVNDRSTNLAEDGPRMVENFIRGVYRFFQSFNNSILPKLPVDLLLSMESSAYRAGSTY